MCSLKRAGSCRCRKVFQSRAEAWLEGPDVQMSTELVSRDVESTEIQKWGALSFCEQLGRKWMLWLKWILKLYWVGNQSEVHVWGKGNLSQNLGTSSSNQSAPFLVFLPPSLIFSCCQLGVLHWSCALFIITAAKVKSHRQGSKQTRRQRKPESTCSYMNKLKTSCLGYYYPRDGFPMIQQTTFDSTLFTWADLKIDMAKSGNTSEMDIAGTWGEPPGMIWLTACYQESPEA